MITPACQIWLSVCTLCLLFLRKAATYKLPPGWCQYFWLLICVRYLISLPGLRVFHVSFEAPVFSEFTSAAWPFLRWFFTLLLLFFFGVRWLYWLRLFRSEQGVPPLQVVQWKQTQTITLRSFRLVCCPYIRVPLTYGIIHPTLLVPSIYSQLSPVIIFPLLSHEAIHIRRFDVLKKRIALFVAILYWYNPCCWLLLFLVERDIELACDAAVLKACPTYERKAYALALLTAAETAQHQPDISLWNHATGGMMKERIMAILKPCQLSRYSYWLLAILFLLILCAILITPSAPVLPDVLGQPTQQAAERLSEQGIHIYHLFISPVK